MKTISCLLGLVALSIGGCTTMNLASPPQFSPPIITGMSGNGAETSSSRDVQMTSVALASPTNSFTGSRQVEPPPPPTDTWSLTLTSRTWSNYLGPNGAVYHDKPVIQTDLSLGHKSGIYLDLWTSFGLENAKLNNDFGDEIDFTAGWAGKGFGLDWNVGATYIASNKWELMKDDIFQFYVEGKKDFILSPQHTISPFARVDYYAPANFEFFKPWVEAGFYHSWKFNDTLSLDSRVSALYDTGIFSLKEGFVAKYKGGLTWKINDKVTVEFPWIRATHPFMDDSRKDEISVGGGFQIKF